MSINNVPCKTCKDFHLTGKHAMGTIAEADTVKRGDTRFLPCPDCSKLFAVKVVPGTSPVEYVLVSAASVNKRFQWMVDGENGTRHKAKGTMTEEEALEKYPNAEKVIGPDVYQGRD